MARAVSANGGMWRPEPLTAQDLVDTLAQCIMWRLAGNDDKESIVFMSDDLSVDEEFVRSVKRRIAGAIGSACP